MSAAFLIMLVLAAPSAAMKSDVLFIRQVNPLPRPVLPAGPGEFSLRQTSEIRLVMTGLVRFYQRFVSPQGSPVCNFTVSCSRFMSQAVHDHGLAHGLLMTGDRLERCGRSARQHYPIDPRSGRAIDYPVRTYYLLSRERTR